MLAGVVVLSACGDGSGTESLDSTTRPPSSTPEPEPTDLTRYVDPVFDEIGTERNVVYWPDAPPLGELDDTKQVFVVVDSSFPMTTVWSQVDDALDELDDEERAEFALATEKDLIHTWQSKLVLVAVEPFAPCDFETISTYPQAAEADELVLITTPSSCDTSGLDDWKVVLLTP